MKKVIVTGASGFIGKALVKKLLKKNVEVWAIVRNKKKLNDIEVTSKLKIIESELKEYKDLDKKISENNFDIFFHLAWDGVYGESFFDYEKQINNIKYGCDALEVARKLNCKKFIFTGTFVEYEVRQYIENNTCNLRIATIYGMSKLSTELFIKTLVNKYKDIEYNIIYPTQVYGEGDKSRMLSRILIENLILGNSPRLSTGNFFYDWIYIEDLIEGIIAVGEKGKNTKSYYIGNKKIYLFKDIVKKVRDIINPKITLKFGEYPDSALIDYDKIDLEELYRDTGFEVKSNFEDTIKKTAKWIKEDMKKNV